MRWRDLAGALLIAFAVTGVLATAPFAFFSGLSIDLLFWLRHHSYGALHQAEDSPTVVVAFDEESHRTPPFDGVPQALWTKDVGHVLDAVLVGGAKVIGFDVIFEKSMESFVPGFDRDFLRALFRGGRERKVVLGKVQHAILPIAPFRTQVLAVGNAANVRTTNLFRDDDAVIRRIPLLLESDDLQSGVRHETSMALELAARWLGRVPEALADGGVRLGDYLIPQSPPNNMPINFSTGIGDVPTYSFADLAACADAGNTEFFARHFAGKVVLLGAVLDVEDRKLTSKRLATGREGTTSGERCVHPPMQGLYQEDLIRDDIPGVFIHANAVNNLLRGEGLMELDRPMAIAITFALGAVSAVVALLLPAGRSGLVLLAGALLWVAAATAAFRHGTVLPLVQPLVAMAATFAALLGYRFTVTDRDKRQLKRAFAFYLAPAVVDRMLAANSTPELGGETRQLTVWFSDLAGFSTFAEGMEPDDLVALMTEYLSAMTEVVEVHGGFVDKYIGDAVVAVFGAPVEDALHARHAVEAALGCAQRLKDLNANSPLLRGRPLAQRIGVNTGQVLVGNIGSHRRFNYTVMGDPVNVASRLEGVNKVYDTEILVTDATAAATGDGVFYREIDTIRVKGRDTPFNVFEPMGTAGSLPADRLELCRRYAEALGHYRAGRFAEARSVLDAIAEGDPPSARLLDVVKGLAGRPLSAGWEPINTLLEK
ncbi:MAG: adenylate/guanylate cyclase domain-containing protein [Proteobacteria bacterium]|nr:adenylate/guanylate cyclase domain-containing protein [Pseudomonadota bacterium]MBI3497123.1 adenylate/guanylate cyclase domain-containing protein [Pseudomonadota bacterium]